MRVGISNIRMTFWSLLLALARINLRSPSSKMCFLSSFITAVFGVSIKHVTLNDRIYYIFEIFTQIARLIDQHPQVSWTVFTLRIGFGSKPDRCVNLEYKFSDNRMSFGFVVETYMYKRKTQFAIVNQRDITSFTSLRCDWQPWS